MGMTPRQRLFHALDGEPTDRIPVWLLFPYHPTTYYVDVRNHPEYRRVVDFSEERGVITLNRRNPHFPLHTPEVVQHEERHTTADGPVCRRFLQHNQVRIHSDQPLAPGGRGKRLVSSVEDLEMFCSLPLENDERRITAAMEAQLEAYQRERAEFPSHLGAMMLDLGSPVNTIYYAADLEEYAMWSLTHDELIIRWLDERMHQLETAYRFCLERDLADVYFLVGSELAAPPLVSRETFQKWVVPYESRLIHLIHSYGKHVIQHYHGRIKEILSEFAGMNPDALHTIEAPPVGNCTLSEAYDVTRSTITLIGNIQYDEFRLLTPSGMKRRVRETLDEVGGRRFILSPTAGPFDRDPAPALIDNYIAFIEAAAEHPV